MRMAGYSKKGDLKELTHKQKLQAALQMGFAKLNDGETCYMYFGVDLDGPITVASKGKDYGGKYENNKYLAKGKVIYACEVYKKGKKPKFKPRKTQSFTVDFEDTLDEYKKIDIKVNEFKLLE